VSFANMEAATVSSAVTNQQVAPTIVQALGFDPNELQAVQKEQIHVLPFLFSGEVSNRASPF
jgi:hypothetical protein